MTTKTETLPQSAKSGSATSGAAFARALVVWLMFIVTESILGTLRTIFLEPRIGVARAQRIGFIAGSLVLLLISWLMIRWIRAARRSTLLGIGLFWAALTFSFEMVLGRALGRSWETLLTDYNPVRGGLMWMAMVLLVFAPLIAGRLRSLYRPD